MEHWCKYFTLAPKLHLPLSPPPVPSNPPLPRLLHLTRPHQFCLFKNTCFLPSSPLALSLSFLPPHFLPPVTSDPLSFFFCFVFFLHRFSMTVLFFCRDTFFFLFFFPLSPRLSHARAQDMNGLFCVWMRGNGNGRNGWWQKGGREGWGRMRGFLMFKHLRFFDGLQSVPVQSSCSAPTQSLEMK